MVTTACCLVVCLDFGLGLLLLASGCLVVMHTYVYFLLSLSLCHPRKAERDPNVSVFPSGRGTHVEGDWETDAFLPFHLDDPS